MMMIPIPKTIGRATSRADSKIAWTNPSPSFLSARCRVVFSTITTLPSTIIPKSMAPSVMRLAESRSQCIPRKENSMESGITTATMRAAREFPKEKEKGGHDEQPALREVFPDGPYGLRDEFGRVVVGTQADARRQKLLD